MKVLIVFNHPAPYKVNLFNELTKYVDLDVIFEREKAKNRDKSFYKNDEFIFNQIKLSSFALKFGNENIISFEVKRYIKKHHQDYDLIVMNGYSTFAEMKAIRYLKKNHIPYALMINGGIPNTKECSFKKKIKTKYISSASWYMSPCEAANEYLTYYGADSSKIYNYPYSALKNKDILDKPLSSLEKKEIRKTFNLPDGELYVCPNQFIPRKNNISLIDLFKGRKEKLLLIGNGPDKEKYENFIKENNLSNVTIMDFQPKDVLMKIIAASDCLVSLSKQDIYGHTILEGMAAGIPIIASKNIVSAQEMIKNNENGFVLNLDHELFMAMDKLNKNMGKESLEKVRKYTIENSAKRLSEIFKEII